MECLYLADNCSAKEIASLLDVVMDWMIELSVAKDFGVKTQEFLRRPDNKDAMKAVLDRAVEELLRGMEFARISKAPPAVCDNNMLKVLPANNMKDLDSTHYFQRTVGGVVLEYVCHGNGVTSDHHQHHQVRA